MDVKTCKQCGEIKPITQFRRYYGGRKGTYTMCMQCERINSREKYLASKATLKAAEVVELDKIHQLYKYQADLGLQPPTKRGRQTELKIDLDGMLDKYENMAVKVTKDTALDALDVTGAPYELTKWLTEELTLEPDYYLDEIYDALLDTYRPCTGIDKNNMMPVYDNKYKVILDRILARFNDYEDSYYEGAE